MAPEDRLQEGDDICKSCTGLLIFTTERKKRGLPPLCVGVPGVAKGRVPKDRVVELNERTKGKLGTYVCFGYSQWTGMMERTGRAPLCLSGIHLNIVSRFAPKKVGDGQKENETQGGSSVPANREVETAAVATKKKAGDGKKKHSPIPGIMGAPPSRQEASSASLRGVTSARDIEKDKQGVKSPYGEITSPSSDTRLQLESAALEFTRLMRKGTVLQYQRMQDFARNIATDPHKKVYRSAERIGASAAKVMGQLHKFWADKWSD